MNACSICRIILRGKVAATDIIFPKCLAQEGGGIYKTMNGSDYFNLKLAEAARAYHGLLQAERPDTRIRILEIGAGNRRHHGHRLAQLDAFKLTSRKIAKPMCPTPSSFIAARIWQGPALPDHNGC